MPHATGSPAADDLAALLGELKERSGLSYGTLAKRLHLSTSTLHRYCIGAVVPPEFAPLDRLARLCRATPQELMELHRRWILADGARRARPGQEAGASAPAAAAAVPAAVPAPVPEPVREADTGPAPSEPTPDGPPDGGGDEPVAVGVPSGGPAPGRGRRRVLLAAVTAAAVLGAVAFSLVPSGGHGNGAHGGSAEAAADQRPAGAAEAAATDTGQPGSAEPSTPGASASTPPGGAGQAPSASPSSSDSAPGTAAGSGLTSSDPAGAATADPGGSPAGASPTATADPAPLRIATRPYVYENPCYQHFLVDSPPQQVGPPANEPEAPRWAAAYGAVASGEQRVALTVQGTGKDTVVLEALHVRVVTKGVPLPWNDYAMGVGCGGGVESASFDIDLDSGSPTVTARGGQRSFPRKVSESDPEVFYVTAHTRAHDVRWELTLDWSSGGRKGTVRVAAGNTPFRTSGATGRPGYDYPLGGSEWERRPR
ncbi:helix-turn-helix domain-containing protein [Kitasatospora sp. NPDC001261]|uniref:helix-turn-helix domain-containing protein n=1 Tax=Kitasatospora sp. NPDC001261 TaxID=3364012 RepID=UPI0036A8DA59